MASWVPACPRGSLRVPAGPCMSPVQPGPILLPLLWGHQGDAEPGGGLCPHPVSPGGGEGQWWQSIRASPALAGAGEVRGGCGAAANYRRCPSCGIDRGSGTGRRPTFPAGLLGNEPGHWGSRLPRQPGGGIWGRESRGGVEPPPKRPELGCSPPNSGKGHPGPGGGFAPVASCGAPRGGGGRILTPAPRGCGFALADSAQGGCQCPPKHPPRSPHPSASGTQTPLSCWGGGRGGSSKKPLAAAGSRHILGLSGVLRVLG